MSSSEFFTQQANERLDDEGFLIKITLRVKQWTYLYAAELQDKFPAAIQLSSFVSS